MISQNYIDRAMTYTAYRNMLDQLMAAGKTTGGNQSEEFIHYAKLNLHRMQRLDKTMVLSQSLVTALKKVSSGFIWLVLTEGWCGDAAQNIPVMDQVTKLCPHIELKLLLRDENLDLMDQYLTNKGRSIPKLICLEKGSGEEKFNWGPRPLEAQNLMLSLKEQGIGHAEKALLIQKWYNADKTASTQEELRKLIEEFLV